MQTLTPATQATSPADPPEGWTDYSAFARRAHGPRLHWTRETDTLMATVTGPLPEDETPARADDPHAFTWSVLHLDGTQRTRRGTAATTAQATLACTEILSEYATTLF